MSAYLIVQSDCFPPIFFWQDENPIRQLVKMETLETIEDHLFAYTLSLKFKFFLLAVFFLPNFNTPLFLYVQGACSQSRHLAQ